MEQFAVLRIVNLVSVFLVILMNTLANALPLAGKTTGEISDRFPVLFTPAGYVFSIWGLIYVLLIGFAVYPLLFPEASRELINRIGYWFVLSCVFNIVWLFAWHYERFNWSLVMMLGLLACLIVLYRGLHPANPTGAGVPLTFWLSVPFSVYLGWISVATIANVSVVLVNTGWNQWGLADTTWTVLLLVIASLLALFFFVRERDPWFVLVFLWAFGGIAVKNAGNPLLAGSALVAAGGVGLLSLLITLDLFQFLTRR